MKKIYLLVITGLLLVSYSFARVATVTNPTNTSLAITQYAGNPSFSEGFTMN